MSQLQKLVSQKELDDGIRYKQKDIAEKTGIHPYMISRMMRNNIDMGNITLRTAIALSEWIGCSVEDLYTKETKLQD